MIRFFIFFVILLTATPFSNVFANDDLLMVRDIAVDVSGKTAIDAREKALTKARRNAFDVLTDRLLSDSEQENLGSVSDAIIAGLVNDFEISREKLSKNRYLARVNVRFNERAVSSYLGRYIVTEPHHSYAYPQAGLKTYEYDGLSPEMKQKHNLVPSSSSTTAKRLLLPWYNENGEYSLWRDQNPWRDAWVEWLNSAQGKELGLVLPLGDSTDIGYYNPDKPLSFDVNALQNLLLRYNATQAIIAMADPLPGGMIRVGLYQSTNLTPRFIKRYTVPAMGNDGNVHFETAIWQARSHLKTMNTTVSQLAMAQPQAGEQFKPFYTGETDGNESRLSPSQNRYNGSQLSFARDDALLVPYMVEIPLRHIQDWIAVKQSLSAVPDMGTIQVKSLSANRALVHFTYMGSPEALYLALSQKGMEMQAKSEETNNAYRLIMQGS